MDMEQTEERKAEDRASAAPTLREALIGLLEIEEARIASGAFKPNAEAIKRIEGARAALASNQGVATPQEGGDAAAPTEQAGERLAQAATPGNPQVRCVSKKCGWVGLMRSLRLAPRSMFCPRCGKRVEVASDSPPAAAGDARPADLIDLKPTEALARAGAHWIQAAAMTSRPHGWYWAEYPGQWIWYSPEHNMERGIDAGDTHWHDLCSNRYWGPFPDAGSTIAPAGESDEEFAAQVQAMDAKPVAEQAGDAQTAEIERLRADLNAWRTWATDALARGANIAGDKPVPEALAKWLAADEDARHGDEWLRGYQGARDHVRRLLAVEPPEQENASAPESQCARGAGNDPFAWEPAEQEKAPAGWKLVPLEPDDDMLAQGKRAAWAFSGDVARIYQWMIAAAPLPEPKERT